MRLPEPTCERLKYLFKSSYYAQALVIKSDVLISTRTSLWIQRFPARPRTIQGGVFAVLWRFWGVEAGCVVPWGAQSVPISLLAADAGVSLFCSPMRARDRAKPDTGQTALVGSTRLSVRRRGWEREGTEVTSPMCRAGAGRMTSRQMR